MMRAMAVTMRAWPKRQPERAFEEEAEEADFGAAWPFLSAVPQA